MIYPIIGVFILVIMLAVGGFLLLHAYFQRPWAHNISYIALPPHAISELLKALELEPDSVLIDLGCGDGRILAAAFRDQPTIQCIGIEHNPLVRSLARVRLRAFSGRLNLVRSSLLDADLSRATHVFTYLNNETMAKLEPKLERELSPGVRLISCDFPLPNKKPLHTINIGQKWQLGQTLYVYKF